MLQILKSDLNRLQRSNLSKFSQFTTRHDQKNCCLRKNLSLFFNKDFKEVMVFFQNKLCNFNRKKYVTKMTSKWFFTHHQPFSYSSQTTSLPILPLKHFVLMNRKTTMKKKCIKFLEQLLSMGWKAQFPPSNPFTYPPPPPPPHLPHTLHLWMGSSNYGWGETIHISQLFWTLNYVFQIADKTFDE